jgi:PAS domain S-box-containing protein
MTTTNQTQTCQILIERQDAIAERWRQAVPRLGFIPFSASEERQHFHDLTRQAIQCLVKEPFDHQAAQAIGARLALLRRSRSEALGSAQIALPRLLIEGLTAEQAADLMPGLEALVSELAVGFFQQACTNILHEQEEIRSALATANARLIQDLHRELEERKRVEQELLEARQALEVRVQERTTELAQANLDLQADINERLRTEQELRLRDRTLTALINAPIDVNVVLDLDGVVQLANQSAATRLGTTVEELTGKSIWDYYPPDMVEYRKKVTEEVIRSRQVRRLDVHGLAGDYDSLAYPILDDQGEVVKVAIMARDITDRLRIEQALRESEERYRTLVEASPDGITVTDLEGRILSANQQFLHLFRVNSLEELQACYPTNLDLLVEEDRPRAAQAMRQVRGDEPRYGTEFLAQRPDSSTFPIDARASPLTDDHGNIVGFTTTVRDISERKVAEAALRASEERYRTLVETSPDGIVSTDLEGHIQTANQRFLQFCGAQSLEELQSYAANPLDLIVEEDRQRAVETLHRPYGNDIYVGLEYTLRRLDGTTLPIAASGSTLLDEKGEVRGFLITVRDISRRKADQEALRKSEALLRSIVTNAPVVLAIISPNGTISMVQSQESTALGWDPRQFTKKNAFEVFQFNPDIARDIKQAFDGETVASIIDTRNGQSYETRYSPIRDEAGKISGVIVVGVNITDRRQAQRQLQKAHDELEQRVAERTAELEYINRELLDEVAMRAQAEALQRRSAQRAEALARMARRINARLDMQAVLKAICEETSQLLHFPGNSVAIYDEDTDDFYLPASLSSQSTPHYHLSGRVYEEFVRRLGPIIMIEDCQAHPEASQQAIIAGKSIRSGVSVPLYYAGKLIGALNLYSQKVEQLPSEEDQLLLQGLANQAAVAITNAHLFEQVSESRQELRALSQRLVEIQEEERRELGRELHDEFGQALTALSLDLNLISTLQRPVSGHPPDILDRFEKIRLQVSQLLDQVRETSLNLRPVLLEDLGLVPALLSYLEHYTAMNHIEVDFKHSGMDRRFSPQVETAAFRIIQEALTNIVRHSQVGRATVRLWSNPQIMGLQVQDHGVGFDYESTRHSIRSSGLSGMSERAHACGGRLEIETEPGEGVLVTAEFPLVEGEDSR